MKKILLALVTLATFNPEMVHAAETALNDTDKNIQCKDIFEATSKGNLSEVKRLVSEGADVNSINWRSGSTPLHIATSGNNLEIVQFLCDHGAVAEIENSDCLLPIYGAASYGHLEVVKYLYDRYYANDPTKDEVILQAFDRAAGCGHLEIVKYLSGRRNLDINREDWSPPLSRLQSRDIWT